jgi:eukaryotic-like serine/threonine-protein kinase
VKGSVAILKDDHRIVTLGQGECVGEMAYLTKMRRTATVRAIENPTLIQTSSALLERVSVTCHLRFNKVFLQTLIERLARTSDKLSKARALT